MLNTLQDIEKKLGRQRIIEKGPRNIDLDIILFDDETIQSERLTIPHRLMMEREFVLRPLTDLIPQRRVPAQSERTIADHLNVLTGNVRRQSPQVVMPLAKSLPVIKSNDPQRPTSIMAVLNITPDSFSKDGLGHAATEGHLIPIANNLIRSEIPIVDIGGQSTRPNAERVSCEEEMARVIPAIETIRSATQDSELAISVDTFYSKVVEAAVQAGAEIINDISAGTLDPNMLPTVARLGKTIVLMHTRGDPTDMNRLTDYDPVDTRSNIDDASTNTLPSVVTTVAHELSQRIDAALSAGIPRWRILLDPGIGFAKTASQNLQLIRHLPTLRNDFPKLRGFPWLLGVSRKGFIGNITGVKEAAERGWGTAAAVTACVAGGADMVRLHDWREMRDVVKMAEAIYRGRMS